MHLQEIFIKDYNYFLPEEKIAKYPLAERDESKLLIYNNGVIQNDIYKNITEHLPSESLLLLNNTKVIEARILFTKPTGGVVEIFCLEPSIQYPDITEAMNEQGKVFWNCMIGGASKWKTGQILEKKINETSLQARYIQKNTDDFLIEFSWQPGELSFAEILHAMGAVPLPPYLKRNAELIDKTRYQTVFAEFKGSVAAPTAGLHFTPYVFDQLKKKNIQTEFITLHVGAGTFKPVKTQMIVQHEMHAESFEISMDTIQAILNKTNRPIIPVGTTSLRTLESLYWMGLKILHKISDIQTEQWDAYELHDGSISAIDSLSALKDLMQKKGVTRLVSKTRLLIVPGYKFRIADALITNFHQPQSTLLLLVAAFIGEDQPGGQAGWRKVYDHALHNDFRFLSYGDGCLLWKKRELNN